MHEYAIAKNIKEAVEQELEQHKELNRITCIKLVIGEMHAVVPEALRFNFGVICANSRFEHTELDIEQIPVEGVCGSCGKDFQMQDHFFICPFCGSVDISIHGGNEFYIKSIIGEE
jgi:hydrogenase nickel incorporation protein HypA/HybF